jgi:hypothetical protein
MAETFEAYRTRVLSYVGDEEPMRRCPRNIFRKVGKPKSSEAARASGARDLRSCSAVASNIYFR